MIEKFRADILTKMTTTANPKMSKLVPMEVKSGPCLKQNIKMMRIYQKRSWMDLIISCKQDGVLPTNNMRARKVRCQASRYTLINGVLYRLGYTLPFLWYLDEDDPDYVLREVHEGVCGNHSGARSLAQKALKQGYFCLMIHQDAQKKTRSCKSCQNFTSFPAQPPEKLTTITSSWSFTH